MAIKLLKQEQVSQAAAFLEKDHDVNALIAEDLKDEQIRVYGQYQGPELTALLIVYPEKIYFCSSVIPADIEAFIPVIQKTGIRRIFGKQELIEALKKIVKTEIESDSVMMKYDNRAAGSVSGEVCKITSLDECRRLYRLFMQVEEYKMTGPNEAFFAGEQYESILSGKLSVYYVEENGTMAATAGIFTDHEKTAVIAGVATPTKYRRKGYASKVIERICRDFGTERELYLFYNNPDAENLYKKLGFYETAKWKVIGISF
ncbi:GNAT family N-acetyltransferase [Metabacillus sp. JX24]|uniref:GNAT family N-acetyltransferase n=1 Tax=Metabacillus sp. JX24 TaxID=3240759 RepID=UPI00350ED4BC